MAVMNTAFLVLMLTGRCNLRCRYCYVDAGADGIDMSGETAFRAIDLFVPDTGAVTVELSGGEPLLRFDLIRKIVEYAGAVNPGVRFAIQTNGTLLDPAKLRYLWTQRIGTGLSMDGIPDVNESLRGGSAGVLRALRLMEESGTGVNITVVLTRENIGKLPQFLLFCAGFSCVRVINLDILRPLGRAVNSGLVPEKGQITDMVDGMFAILSFINERRFPPLKIREIAQAKRRRNDKEIKPYCHGAAGDAVAVTPDGRLFPCASLMDMDQYQAGTVWSPDLSRLQGLVQTPLYPEKCMSCELRPVCRGGCPSRRVSIAGDIKDICDVECHMRKEIWRRIAE